MDLISDFESLEKNWTRHAEDKVDSYRELLLALFVIAPFDIEEKLCSSFLKRRLEFYRCQSAVQQVSSLGARDQVLSKRLIEKKIKRRGKPEA